MSSAPVHCESIYAFRQLISHGTFPGDFYAASQTIPAGGFPAPSFHIAVGQATLLENIPLYFPAAFPESWQSRQWPGTILPVPEMALTFRSPDGQLFHMVPLLSIPVCRSTCSYWKIPFQADPLSFLFCLFCPSVPQTHTLPPYHGIRMKPGKLGNLRRPDPNLSNMVRSSGLNLTSYNMNYQNKIRKKEIYFPKKPLKSIEF